jgi:hypothetical protein
MKMLKNPGSLWLSLLLLLFAYGCAGGQEPPAVVASSTPSATHAVSPIETPTEIATTPAPTSTSTLEKSSLITPQEYAVYDAMIANIFLPSGYESIVIVDQTVAGISSGPASQQDLDNLRQNMAPDLQAETLADFVAKNERSYRIENHFSLDVPVVLISNQAVDEFFAAQDGWERFYEQYPNSQGMMTVSRVGFNPSGQQALVYVGNQADLLAGEGNYVLLSKEGDQWKVTKTFQAWIS